MRWCRIIQNVSINYHNSSIYNCFNRVTIYSEGTLADFFLSYQLTLKDVFWVKRLSHAYFKNVAGKSHKEFAKELKGNNFFLMPKKIFSFCIRKVYKRKKISRSYYSELNLLRKLIECNDMYVANFFNSELKNYIINLYSKLKNYEKQNWKKKDVMEICRLANTDIMLRNVGGEKNE